MCDIRTEFAAHGIKRGSGLYFPAEVAIQFVRRCQEEGVRIVGIEAFWLTSTSTQPVMEHSVDLDRLEDTQKPENSWERAEYFLRQRIDSDLYFDVETAD